MYMYVHAPQVLKLNCFGEEGCGAPVDGHVHVHVSFQGKVHVHVQANT